MMDADQVAAVGTVMQPRSVAILGSTGSIGCSTLDLIARHPGRYVVSALAAQNNWQKLAEQALATRAAFVAIGTEEHYAALRDALAGSGIEVAAGRAAVVEAARRPSDWVMAAIVGAAGLAPTLAAIERGVAIALANKEVLVCAGDLVKQAVTRHGATLLPVDSEHNAIFQVFDAARPEGIEKIILTASGGPFRTASAEFMATATPAQALKHPNWSMGAKISIDSATMMNKGLELIEACHLFDMPADRIDIVIHPQSVIHSLVAYIDGSVLAQLGSPDMRTPIAHALAWPARIAAPSARLDLAALGQLTFQAPDEVRFPALRLARRAAERGGSMPTVLNGANEIAVAGFLGHRLGFLEIADVVEETVTQIAHQPLKTLDDVHNFDKLARETAERIVQRQSVRRLATA